MWILDSLLEISKLSPVQVAILFEYAKAKGKPRRVTEIMKSLREYFEGHWEPKKGTIYPSVHNLDIRGFLKLHGVKPYGYSITDKGLETLKEMLWNMEKQLAVHIRYYEFIIDGLLAMEPENAEKILEKQIDLLKGFTEKIEEI